MVDDQESAQDKVAPPAAPVKSMDPLSRLLADPTVREIGMGIVKKGLRDEFGIGKTDPQVTKKPFGRAMYAMRDFFQGVWWILPLLVITLGLSVIILKVLAKMAGVTI